MPRPRKENPELEKMVRDRRKKFVRYEEGAQIYSMGLIPLSSSQKMQELCIT